MQREQATALRLIAASIRANLLLWLLPPLMMVVVFASLMDYRAVDRTVDAAFDRVLQNVAVAIASGVRARDGRVAVDLPAERLSVLLADQSDKLRFRVIGPSGETLAGVDDLYAADVDEDPAIYDDRYLGDSVRTVVLPVATELGRCLVVVNETQNKRDRSRREFTTALLVEDVIILVLAAGVCLFAVSIALKPVERLAAEVALRSAGDLRPLSLSDTRTPREILPLTDALNRLFDRLAQNRDAQRRFVENAAHQLRTPLTGVKGHLEIALGQARRLQVQQGGELAAASNALVDRLDSAERAADRLVRLTNQLLALSRADQAAREPADRDRVRLPELVDDVISDCVDTSLAQQQDLGAETDDAQVLGVRWQLREMLANLVDNAIRYTPRGGRITVRCGCRDGAAFVEVEDSGTGIPASERGRVFERFYRMPGAPSGGSGLGLAIVREIADLHAAQVLIADGEHGRGTLVRVTFPVAASIGPAAPR